MLGVIIVVSLIVAFVLSIIMVKQCKKQEAEIFERQMKRLAEEEAPKESKAAKINRRILEI